MMLLGVCLIAIGAWRVRSTEDGFSVITGFYVILAGAILVMMGVLVDP